MGKQTRKQRLGAGRLVHLSFTVVRIPKYDAADPSKIVGFETIMSKPGTGITYKNLERTLKKDTSRVVAIHKNRPPTVMTCSYRPWFNATGSAYYTERRTIRKTEALMYAL